MTDSPILDDPMRLPEHIANSHSNDFISLISAISLAYRNRKDYQKVHVFGKIEWSNLDKHTSFSVYNGDRYSTLQKIVIRTTTKWSFSEQEIRDFVRELRILDHCHGSSNIVRLHAIGWLNEDNQSIQSPRPCLMIERPEATLAHATSQTLRLEDIFTIFYDVVNGLIALHSSGIVHGDVTTSNIFLFRHTRVSDGHVLFTAKIASFECSMLNVDALQRSPARTSVYTAPEHQNQLTFTGLQKLDTYSSGVLLLKVLLPKETDPNIEEIKSLISIGGNPIPTIAGHIVERSEYIKTSDLTPIVLRLIYDVLLSSLQHDPAGRDLRFMLQCLRSYGIVQHRVNNNIKNTIVNEDLPKLHIFHSIFREAGGVIRSWISQGLGRIVSAGNSDPRYVPALFELGIIHIIRFDDPEANTATGLHYLWLAASKGSWRAQVLYFQLQRALSCVAHQDHEQTRKHWLLSAAANGSQVALDELSQSDPESARTALTRYGLRFIEMADYPKSSPVDRETLFEVHQAAASGSLAMKLPPLQNSRQLLNLTNGYGDTPLITACRFGQYASAMALIELQADASISNLVNENAFHFLWRFSASEAESLSLALSKAGGNPVQRASFSDYRAEYGLDCRWMSTPAERLIFTDRLDILKCYLNFDFVQNADYTLQLCQLLLLSVNLHQTNTQKLLLRHLEHFGINLASAAQMLHGDPNQMWSELAINELSYAQYAYFNLPKQLSLLIHHGKAHIDAMRGTIDNFVLNGSAGELNEASLDKFIMSAFRNGASSTFQHLMNIKIAATNASNARPGSLHILCWESGLRSQTVPVTTVNYIDQIFLYRGPITLLQQALYEGDRNMFYVLTRNYGADPMLPMKHPIFSKQLNGYSFLSLCGHRDIWFANELKKLGVPLQHPYGENLTYARTSSHPLKIAIEQKWRAYAQWLLQNGCSLFEPSGHATVLLKSIMDSADPDVFEFLFPLTADQRDLTWCLPSRVKAEDDYAVLLALYESYETLDDFKKAVVAYKFTEAWFRLLSHFAHLENQPSVWKPSVLKMTLRTARLHDSKSFELDIIPQLRCRITIGQNTDHDKVYVRNMETMTLEILSGTERLLEIQPFRRLLFDFVFGSPLNDLPRRQFSSLGLSWYRSRTSIPDSVIFVSNLAIPPIDFEFIGVLLVCFGSVIIPAAVHIARYKSFLILMLDLGLSMVFVFCAMFAIGVAFLGKFLVDFFVQHICVLTYAYMRFVYGPGVIPRENFEWGSNYGTTTTWLQKLLKIES